MTVREEFEAWAVINWMYVDRKEDALVIWLDAYAAGRRAGIDEAAQMVELEYAPDKKASDRLKQIAQHIRAMKAQEDNNAVQVR